MKYDSETWSFKVNKRNWCLQIGGIRGVAHVKKGRKSKGRLRYMDVLRVSLNDLIQLPLMVGAA